MESVRLTVIATGFAVEYGREEEEGGSLSNESMLAKLEQESRVGADDYDIPTFLRRGRRRGDEPPRPPWGEPQGNGREGDEAHR